MKELESSMGKSIGGGFLPVRLAPEPRFSGEGNPRVASLQIPQASSRFSIYGVAVGRPTVPIAIRLR